MKNTDDLIDEIQHYQLDTEKIKAYSLVIGIFILSLTISILL